MRWSRRFTAAARSTRLLHGLAALGRPPAARSRGSKRHHPPRLADRRRRLRPRRTVPALRRRHPDPAEAGAQTKPTAPRSSAWWGCCGTSGSRPGHSVRTLEECREEAARDVTVLTSMLESRLIAGSRRQFEAFSRAVVDVVDREAYFQAKLLEQQQRHVEVQRDAVQPRAQRQGKPRRPARPARRAVDRARRRLRHALDRTGAPRPADRGRGEASSGCPNAA